MRTPLLDEDCKAVYDELPPSRKLVESLISDDPLEPFLTQEVHSDIAVADLLLSPEALELKYQAPEVPLGLPTAQALEPKPLPASLSSLLPWPLPHADE